MSHRGFNSLLLLWVIQCILNHREEEWILWAFLKKPAYGQKQIKSPLKKLRLLLLKLYLQQEREESSHKWENNMWDSSSVLVAFFWIGINSNLKSFWIESCEAFLIVLCHNGLQPLRSAEAACEAFRADQDWLWSCCRSGIEKFYQVESEKPSQ